MKKGDTLFKEQFIILHNIDGEVVIRKSAIKAISIDNDNKDHSDIDIGADAVYEVNESIDEILELL